MTIPKKRSTALLVMDFQRAIVDRLENLEAVGFAADAITAARRHHLTVIFVRVAFRPGYPEVNPANQSFAALTASGGDDMTIDNPKTHLHDQLAPADDDVVVVKKRISAFTGSDLEVVLRSRNITNLVLAGISTSGVVLSTVREAADRDYRLTVLANACADHDAELHRVLLNKVFPRQAEVLTVAEWTAVLDADQ